MPIKQITPETAVFSYMDKRIKRLKQALIYNLSYVGEKVRNEAVINGSYKDQTRNLRGSIGYVIAVDGRLERVGDFGKSNSNNEGKTEGKFYAEELISRFPKGVVLIVVAGMNYATYVSAKGYNVLDSAEIMAERLVPKMLKQLGFK